MLTLSLLASITPAITSVMLKLIGKVKFMPHYKLSIHNLAAFTIGRRYLQFNENVPKRLKKTSWKDVYKMKVS